MKKDIIYGCEERGDYDSPYLTRYTLIECKWFQVCLHVFHRSDNVEHHDHPWNYVSLILWRGYLEETIQWPHCPDCGDAMRLDGKKYQCPTCGHIVNYNEESRRLKKMWPGMILFRRASHRHRIVLVGEKKAVTLVIMGKRLREWGFFTSRGWMWWRRYLEERGC